MSQTERPILSTSPERIPLEDDELLRDDIFCLEVLAGSSRRSSKRQEAKGLPYVMVRGIKYRPLRGGRAWLAGQIQRPNQPPKKKKAS